MRASSHCSRVLTAVSPSAARCPPPRGWRSRRAGRAAASPRRPRPRPPRRPPCPGRSSAWRRSERATLRMRKKCLKVNKIPNSVELNFRKVELKLQNELR